LGVIGDEECDCHTLVVIEREREREREQAGNIGSPRAMGKKEKRLAIHQTGWSTMSLRSGVDLGWKRLEARGRNG
jgi:hypothetical protein